VIRDHCFSPLTKSHEATDSNKAQKDDIQEAVAVNETDETVVDEPAMDDPVVIDAIPVDPKIEQSIVKADRIYHQQAHTIYNIEHIDTFNA